jgi:hypothetical protein
MGATGKSTTSQSNPHLPFPFRTLPITGGSNQLTQRIKAQNR